MADTVNGDENLEMSSESETMAESRRQLRRHWELASVLNFLRVFEPVIGKEVKMSALDIETALILPNLSLANLHITLLKGIPPVNKNLSNPDAWVTILCKKLAEWWPWVADGKVPLTAEKGEEISKYKELEPAIRLSMLKALCELRTEQVDLMSYVNDELKQGADISRFRVEKISENKIGISYWYDGDSFMGYRLYKEVNKPHKKSKYKGKGCIDLPPNISEWETLATNLDEFRKFSEELSSSSDAVEGSVYQAIETEVIPALEKLKKKQENVLKRRQREEARLNNYCSYVPRTCRTRKPVKYTFDEYDQAIEEAIKVTREGKHRKVERTGKKPHENGKRGSHASNGEKLNDVPMEEGSSDSVDADEQNNDIQVEDSDSDHSTNNNGDTIDTDSDASNSSLENVKRDTLDSQGQNGLISNGRTTEDSSNSSSGHHSLRAKNRLSPSEDSQSQVATKNSALDSRVVPDSDSGSASDNACSEDSPSQVATKNSALDSRVVPDSDSGSASDNACSEDSPSQVADSEDEMSS
ncbi:DDT domain-containing protein DDR4 [Silene latifolia]|uniref:DDT domain-containing protein DDR4 n=1 Tax=Silene latifolia TaxID=37657 RepID=UPI003D76C2A6